MHKSLVVVLLSPLLISLMIADGHAQCAPTDKIYIEPIAITGRVLVHPTNPCIQQNMRTYAWQSVNYQDRFIRHRNFLGFIEPINDRQAAKDAVFIVQPGLAGGCYSFESTNFHGFYLRHENFRIKLS